MFYCFVQLFFLLYSNIYSVNYDNKNISTYKSVIKNVFEMNIINKPIINRTFNNKRLTGLGVHVYIVDSGISTIHSDFMGRLGKGVSFVLKDNYGWNDCLGHGTHVAGIIGGTNYGIAKKSILHAVKVFNCSGEGYSKQVLNGLTWILNDVKKNNYQKVIVSMSLHIDKESKYITNIINKLYNNNIIVVVASGNNNSDACNTYPANLDNVITVGAINKHNIKTSFSNYGSCVDVFSPGKYINSTWIGSSESWAILSGTSMSTPYISGIIALLLELLSNNFSINILKKNYIALAKK